MSAKKPSSPRAPAKKSGAAKRAEPAAALPRRSSVKQNSAPAKAAYKAKSGTSAKDASRPAKAALPVRAPAKSGTSGKPTSIQGSKHAAAATKKARALPPPKSNKKTAAPAASASVPKPAPAVKSSRAKVVRGKPTLEELKGMQTEEVWSLYRKAKKSADDPAWSELLRNALMELHYPLVRHIAERLLQTLPKSIELDDLVSAGVFGLMDAIRGFDPDRGIKFKTYCTTRIRGSILDQLRSQDWVPRLVRLKAGRIDKAFQKLRGEYGREPTHAELATYLKMDHEELITEIDESRARQITSINERWNEHDDDSSMEKVDIVQDPNAIDPINEMNKRDMLKYITRSLTHKEQFIIVQYYQTGHTMREIGEMLALTESRVCQIHSNVMSRLKSLLGPKSGGFLA
jgi:RNA polymerase sigma factor for flagellar operon FliA